MKSIFVVGQTATGKTDLAIHIAKFLASNEQVKGVDILSADSKQVFKGLDIVTGKDLDKFAGLDKKISVYGLDLADPSEEWSISHFIKYAEKIAKKTQKDCNVLIVVGGAGQYIRSLTDVPATINVLPDYQLRQRLEHAGLLAQQRELIKVDRAKFESMNNSDRMNPRRLIRAIEVAINSKNLKVLPPIVNNPLILGLKLSYGKLADRINQRVTSRLIEGAIEETKKLMPKMDSWSPEAKATIGYQDIKSYLDGEITEEQMMDLWALRENQYSKKQQVWFKTMNVKWFAADEANLHADVDALIKSWYTEA